MRVLILDYLCPTVCRDFSKCIFSKVMDDIESCFFCRSNYLSIKCIVFKIKIVLTSFPLSEGGTPLSTDKLFDLDDDADDDMTPSDDSLLVTSSVSDDAIGSMLVGVLLVEIVGVGVDVFVVVSCKIFTILRFKKRFLFYKR